MTTEASTDTVNDQEKLWGLIKDLKFAMFTTLHSENGHLHSRPMTTQNSKLDESASLWFFMSRKSETVSDIASKPLVNVSYADPGKDSYLSVAGSAAVVEDLAKKQQLWSKTAEAWFPSGVEDPDLALVQVRITHADYWDVKESKVTQLYKMAKAVVTGTTPTDMGEHGKLHMN